MINTSTETVLPLAQLAEELPRRRRGRKTHVSTLYRWATVGCRGVRLETLQIGATRCTSREAMQRFFERLTAASGLKVETHAPEARRLAEAADAELRRLGFVASPASCRKDGR